MMLEQHGMAQLPSRHGPNGELRLLAENLGMLAARQSGTQFPGSIYVVPEIPLDRSAGWVMPTGDALPSWVDRWIMEPANTDNRNKLGQSQASERHLFVIVPGIATRAPFPVSDLLMRSDAPLPTVAPELPDEVTHVWVMGVWRGGRGYAWGPNHGWSHFAIDAQVDRGAVVACTCS
jgi:hypothetical protein